MLPQCTYFQSVFPVSLHIPTKHDSIYLAGNEKVHCIHPIHYIYYSNNRHPLFSNDGISSDNIFHSLSSLQNNICGNLNKVKRDLVPNSMKVYPLYDNNVLYGFIQEGEHDFAEFSQGKWNKGSRAKFTILWILQGKDWKMKRVLSYDHHL